ncbi:hypothetical protein DWF00_23770 [Bosea caraganae]|uniref:Uncharacterized protein n=1 Tax=Bosea caraganae TaxID=2763117 RepID=A0A370L223_9HYPH|nr:hypothetical protein [Bosea caraganae]RDJ22139.1 hypothetical protein DWE98_19775 [Bosea caraganae]RDJ22774.1 hypothetical protein DWF00_23770 [Bosea caraganae]
MPHDPARETEALRAELRQALMSAFCNALHNSQLSPLAVMELTAEAVGAIYQEVVEAHRLDGDCPCGWRPSAEADIETLRAALDSAARPVPVTDLRLVRAAGRAWA